MDLKEDISLCIRHWMVLSCCVQGLFIEDYVSADPNFFRGDWVLDSAIRPSVWRSTQQNERGCSPSRFFFSALGTWMYAVEPKMRKLETSGFVPGQFWYGVFGAVLVDTRFNVYTAQAMASPQSSRGTFLAWMRYRAASIMVLLAHNAVIMALSDTPFCSGMCGADVSNFPFLDSQSLK